MRSILLAALLLLALAPLAPGALAHQCSGGNDCVCPVPNDGQYHQHTAGGRACQGGPGGSQDAGAGGASQSVPGVGVGLGVAVVILVALARRR